MKLSDYSFVWFGALLDGRQQWFSPHDSFVSSRLKHFHAFHSFYWVQMCWKINIYCSYFKSESCGWARGNDSCVTNKILIKIKENESVSFYLYHFVRPSNYFGQQICFVDEIWCARNGIEEMKVITSKWLVLLSLLILLLLVSNFCHPILCYSDTLVITPHITHMQIRIHSHPICEVPKYFPN